METDQIDNVYFDEYENLEVHQLMLEDSQRNLAYQNAILNNKKLFKDKVVLDVGAGTGILSIFCAQAGALKVYAVEASNLYETTIEVIKENNYDHIIEVFHSKIEDFKLKNDDKKVDIIVSEWMGFYLLHEGMLDSIIFARDNFLKADGLIFPNNATIYCAPCSVPSMYDFWQNINGISMNCVGKKLRASKSKPEIMQLNSKDLLSEGKSIFWIDLNDVKMEELNTIYYQDIVSCSKVGKYQGLCIWFTVQFPSEDMNEPVILSTSPFNSPTHWKQTVIVLPNEINVEEGSPIAYELFIKRNEQNSRRYNIEFVMLDPENVAHPEPCDCYMTKCILIKKMLEQYEQENS